MRAGADEVEGAGSKGLKLKAWCFRLGRIVGRPGMRNSDVSSNANGDDGASETWNGCGDGNEVGGALSGHGREEEEERAAEGGVAFLPAR
ncbi:hypothetical protein K505DRAFT_121929 [Melanomma pulvis-pyrius CBS 109.77]|uniref:Uncharacterized protein n=1 Tax=Melanomma pulvis-pyrius CBS 109.77 TaxID=1314802 RepID=A0A6A6WUL6_9PLEO|nr:hypothetical protein K505DRAFT_121929 [Melanomma pulvis-pyrius CBS 109.77]